MLGNTTGHSMLLRAEPLTLAEEISRRMVGVCVLDDALLLDADPTWADAISTVLVEKGVRVDELTDCSRSNNQSCGTVPTQDAEPGLRGTRTSRLEKWLRENPMARRCAHCFVGAALAKTRSLVRGSRSARSPLHGRMRNEDLARGFEARLPDLSRLRGGQGPPLGPGLDDLPIVRQPIEWGHARNTFHCPACGLEIHTIGVSSTRGGHAKDDSTTTSTEKHEERLRKGDGDDEMQQMVLGHEKSRPELTREERSNDEAIGKE